MHSQGTQQSTPPSDKQKAALALGNALNVAPTLKTTTTSAKQEKPEPPPIWQSVTALGEGTNSAKAVAKVNEQAIEIATAVGPARDLLKDLGALAGHAALKSDPGTGQTLQGAATLVQNVETYAVGAQSLAMEVRSILAEAAKEKLPTMPKSRVGGQERAKLLGELQKAKAARDTKTVEALAAPLAKLPKLAEDAARATEELATLKSAWQGQAAKYDSEAAQRKQREQAIADGKDAYQRCVEAKGNADKDDLLAKAKALKVAPPDLDQLAAQAQQDAERDNWIAAGQSANRLIKAVERLRRLIVNTEPLKANFETVKSATNGRLSKLEKRLDAAQVHDKACIATLRDLLKQANAAAAKGEWADASQHIEDFSDQADEAEALAGDFGYYSDGKVPRLLTGTIIAVFSKLPGGSSNADALTELEAAYQQQCLVMRNDWLTHLNIAGADVKVGNDQNHYTTFNNSVPVGTDVNVSGLTLNQVCAALFEVVAWHQRIHSTYVDGADRYHRYWSQGAALYSANVDNPNPWPALDVTYNRMVKDMRDGVKKVIDLHGRIGPNALGPHL